jgi:UDPglucose 6-dehydrogenase/GDP-mannose 6-dehydrogenase
VKISIVGTGYVGLVSGACLAEKGHTVICVDVDKDKVDRINAGQCPIYEEGLESIVKRNVGARLSATTDLAAAVLNTEITLIAVGTPFDGQAIDTGYIETASREIGDVIRVKDDFHAVVIKSTVVPGTTDDVATPILEAASGKKAGQDFGVGMNPEFLREGVAIPDFMEPDRIVYGATDERTFALLDEVYSVFQGVDIIRTSNKTAEMIKYTANSLLATLISFSNEIGNLCTALGEIDVVDVMKGVHLDRRLSPILESGDRVVPSITTFIEAGCGFGGSCFPKDVKALIAHGQAAGQPMKLLQSVIDINRAQPMKVMELLRKHFDSLRGLKVAVMGLAFKPGTDDMRESPSIPIVKALHDAGAVISAYDPVAIDEAQKVFAGIDIEYASSIEEAVQSVDAVVIVTIWNEFRSLPEIINRIDSPPLLIDGRRMIDRDAVSRYDGIGMTSRRIAS